MKHYTILYPSVVLFLAGSSIAIAGHDATVSQQGSNDTAEISQTNSAATMFATINTLGQDNYTQIVQDASPGAMAVISQEGDGNSVRVRFRGVATGDPSVYQTGDYGDSNSANEEQTGDNNIVNAEQSGSYNTTDIYQAGDWDSADTDQVGDLNEAYIEQLGSYNTADIYQSGNWNEASITQSGTYNTASIDQMSNANIATISQAGSYHTASIVQAGGADNIASIVQAN